MAWSELEVEATVADYFHMLVQELTGQSYSKTAHRHVLLRKLQNRSEGAIERKHQNISAILIEFGCPYISGYKPLGNYQGLLREIVEQHLNNNPILDQAALTASALPAVPPLPSDYEHLVVDPPKQSIKTKESTPKPYHPQASRKDYLERESRNASLGLAGEEFILQYEYFRLHKLGKAALAEKVEHIARTKGDGLGFDILSFESSGKERFIEVKTTSFGKETPFFVSRGEVRFAEEHEHNYQLYRLYNFRQSPKLFQLSGRIHNHCTLNPITFICQFS